MRIVYTPLITFLVMNILFVYLPPVNIYADTSNNQKIDEISGLTYEQLQAGKIPLNLFWEFIGPQRDYLKKTFGEDISTTYALHNKELARLDKNETQKEDSRILEIKTIRRWPDPVLFLGSNIPEWNGKKLTHLRLYACRLGKFVPIPYQFDEFTEEGEKVLSDGGPDANPEDGNGLLDPYDEFVFMAHDLGDRVRPKEWLDDAKKGIEKVLEIKVKDPLDQGTGWCYLLLFADQPPPRSPLNYASYTEKYNQSFGFYHLSQNQFKVRRNKLYRQIFTQKWLLPDYAGGNFTNYVDRLKFRVQVRLFFGRLKITTCEDDVTSNTMALRDGPVRCTRRCYGQVQLPLGFKTPKIVSDVIGYDTMFTCPVKLSVPINPGLLITDLTLYSGTDLNSSASGSRWYNSNNIKGFAIDGKMTKKEKKMDEAIDEWRLITGPFGTMMNRSAWDPVFRSQAKIRIQFTDDETLDDPPEYFPGQIGMAYNYSTIGSLKAGTYSLELDWFFPPWFNPADHIGDLNSKKVKAQLDMFDHPIEISTGKEYFINNPAPH